MKILFPEWKSFGSQDIVEAFTNMGHEVKCVPFSSDNYRHDQMIQNNLISEIRLFAPDFVFTLNYFPVVSLACKSCDIKYVSWIYDSPFVLLYSYTVIYPGNYIFVFDKEQYMELHKAGIKTIHYLPLAASPNRLQTIFTNENLSRFHQSLSMPQTGISFVGSLYDEEHQFYNRLQKISQHTRGYLEGLMNTQKHVYGTNFIQELLPSDILNDLQKALPMDSDVTGVESREYLYAQYVINRHLTSLERKEYLSLLGQNHSFDLYTPNPNAKIFGAINHGPVDYYEVAPMVFHESKINLNISLRSIKSGIPLRAFDIIGAGGFLLTNYQADFADCFVSNEDYVYFESRTDFLSKIDYYLRHKDERTAIARNGLDTLKAHHTYKHRIEEIISTL